MARNSPVSGAWDNDTTRLFQPVIQFVHIPEKLFVARTGIKLLRHNTRQVKHLAANKLQDVLKKAALSKEGNEDRGVEQDFIQGRRSDPCFPTRFSRPFF